MPQIETRRSYRFEQAEELQFSDEIIFGWITDIHLGDNNHDDKLVTLGDDAIERIVPKMIEKEAEFIVNTGDMIDNFHKSHDEVIGFHREVKRLFDQYSLKTYYVIGNHDVQTNTKQEVLNVYKISDKQYVFQEKGVTFIVLDQQFNPDGSSYDAGKYYIPGSIPLGQLEWLRQELEKAPGKVILLTHQPIFSIADEDGPAGEIYTHNGELLQNILENSEKILAGLSGHRQASPEERRRDFGGVKHFILPSPIFKNTRLSYGIVKISADRQKVEFNYYMDENHDKIKIKYDQLVEECRGPEEKEDYYALQELAQNNWQEFQKIKKAFDKYGNTNFRESSEISEIEKQQLRDFEDYDCYRKYLEARKEFIGY